jgi:hypothetical protein
VGPPAGIGVSFEDGEPSLSWMVDLHHFLMLPVSIPVGIVSGYGMHALLAPVLLGTVNKGRTPWPNVALPILGTITAASLFYFTQCSTYDTSSLFWEVNYIQDRFSFSFFSFFLSLFFFSLINIYNMLHIFIYICEKNI